MATLKPIVRHHTRRKDGKFPIAIRLTHKQQAVQIPTHLYVSDKQLTKTLDIKDAFINRELNNRLAIYEELILGLSIGINSYTAKELAEYLTRRSEGNSTSIDFFTFADNFIDGIKAKQPGTAENHKVMLSNLERYLDERRFAITDITAAFLSKYQKWMDVSGGVKRGKKGAVEYVPLGSRGQSLYLGSIRTIFNAAQSEYNDYDKNDILIPNRPFERFKIPKTRPIRTAEQKALSVEQIKAIRDFAPKTKRAELAQDCFMLSFYLCGMNSVDLYQCDQIKDGIITYYRSKTTKTSEDKAEMRIQVEPEVEPLLEKYRGTKTVFNFAARHASKDSFNARINAGLKLIGKAIGIDDLEFYYARHSWASIAANDLRIPESTVDACLAHSPTNKMLHKYVKKDWTKIYEANRKVLDLINT